jgi:hypothetical protein
MISSSKVSSSSDTAPSSSSLSTPCHSLPRSCGGL